MVSSLWDSLIGDSVASFTDAPSERCDGEFASRRGGDNFHPADRKPRPNGLEWSAEIGCKLGMDTSALSEGEDVVEGTVLSWRLENRLLSLVDFGSWVSVLGFLPLFLPMYIVPLLLTFICFPSRASIVEATAVIAEETGADADFKVRGPP